MPFFTPYMKDLLDQLQESLDERGLSPLTTIEAVEYTDIKKPQRKLTMWLAYSDDKMVGWYKYEGYTSGGTRQMLFYNNQTHSMPSRVKMRARQQRV